MNVSQRILHSEIQNLGQMIQIVSYELTLLSDFMKEKFGASFEAFREKHSDQANISQSSLFAESEPTSSKKINVTARKSTSPLQRKWQSGSASSEAKRMKTSGEGDDDSSSDDEDDGNENKESWKFDGAPKRKKIADDSAMGKDFPISGDEDDISVVAENDIPKGAQLLDFTKPKDPEEKLVGRVRSSIWNKYIVSKLPDGKLHAKCPRCKNPVSCKVERLTKHYRKCVLETRHRQSLKRKLGASKTFSDTEVEEDDKRKVAEYIKTMNKNSDDNKDPLETESTSKVEGQEIVFDHSIQTATGGRRADPVWEYFTVLEDPETKRRTVRCKRCHITVSSKVERVRRHFVICQELDKEGDHDDD